MTPRIYSNIAVQTSLVSGITAAATSLTVADATGYPAAPFAIVVDVGSATYEEVMLVTAKAGAVFTVTRAYDGTTAKIHAAGALIIHTAIADDFRGMQLGTRDVSSAAPADGDVPTWVAANAQWEPSAGGGGGGAPTNATYVTLTANASLTAEAVLGSAVIMAGLAAARPAAGTAGRLYYATDTDTLSRDNGVSWDDLTLDWGQITGEPTTLAGYGITDAASDAELATHEADTTAVHGIANTANLIQSGTGAGGVLSGTYPSPGFAVDMATQAELDAHASDTTAVHGIADTADLSTNIPNDSITYAKIQNVTATDKVLGRSTAGAGDVEEITFTAAARALADDATAAAMLVTLGAATAIAEGRPKTGATIPYTIPGVEMLSTNTFAIGTNTVRYNPMFVSTPITLDQIAIEVTSAGAGGTTARLGIYHADADWQPTALVVDAGTVAVDSTGVKTASINTTLQPGRYLLAFNASGAPTLRTRAGATRYMGSPAALGTAFTGTMSKALAYAAFTDPGTAWDTTLTSGSGFICFIFVRVATP